jgi:hypothetical protein
LPKKGEKVPSDRYLAKGLVIDHIDYCFRRVLKELGLNFDNFERVVDNPIKAKEFLLKVPASVAVGRFVKPAVKEKVMKTAKTAWELVGSEIKEEVLKILRDLLQEHVVTVTGIFNQDFLDIANAMFADNVALDVTDIFILEFPIACLFCCEGARDAVSMAADIRGQISWGMVKDFGAFVEDIVNWRISVAKTSGSCEWRPKLKTEYSSQDINYLGQLRPRVFR